MSKHPLPISSSTPEQLTVAPVLQQMKDPCHPVGLQTPPAQDTASLLREFLADFLRCVPPGSPKNPAVYSAKAVCLPLYPMFPDSPNVTTEETCFPKLNGPFTLKRAYQCSLWGNGDLKTTTTTTTITLGSCMSSGNLTVSSWSGSLVYTP